MFMKKESIEKIQGNILVISSDSDLKSDISLFLKPYVQHIKYLSEAELAIEKIDEEKPNLILLDAQWNIGASYGLCQNLKTYKLAKNIPIILIGDFKEENKLSSCVEEGANDFISTPFKKLELVMRVKTQLALYFANKHNQQLLLTEAYHTSAIKVINEGFVVQDKSDKIVSANEAAADILGLTYNQLVGKDSFDPRWKALHEDGSPFTPEEHPSMISLKKCVSVNNVIMNVHTGENDRKWLSINARPIFDEEGNQTGAVSTFMDITETKEANEKLKESEEKFANAFNGSPIAQAILNIKTGYRINVNKEFCKFFGYTKEEALTISLKKSLLTVNHTILNEAIRIAVKNGELVNFPIEMYNANSEVRNMIVNATNTFLNDENIFLVSYSDITNTLEAESALKESENKFATAFKYSPIAQSILNLRTGNRINANQVFCKLFGYNKEKALTIKAVKSPLAVDQNILKKGIKMALKNGELVDFALDMYGANGEIRNMIVNATNTFLKDKDIFLVSYSDVTNAREAEQKIKESEKDVFNAIIISEEKERARYAKELHDGLGPILSTSMIYLHTMLQEKDRDKQTEYNKRAYALLEDATQSIREISSNLSPDILKKYGLVQAVRSFIEKLQEVSRVKFKINSNLTNEFNELTAFTLYRTLTELINNSIKHADASKIEISFDQSPTGIKISYADDGSGFDYEKAKKESNGFGLLNLESRIKKIGGQYKFVSRKGKGSQVKIKLQTIGNDTYSYN